MIEEILQIKKRCDFGDEIGRTLRLTLGEVDCISAIARHEVLSSKELSSILKLSPSRGSRVINKLVERNLINSRVDPNDRRSLLLSLSSTGYKHFIELEEEKRKCEQRLFAQLNQEQLHDVEKGLKILLTVL